MEEVVGSKSGLYEVVEAKLSPKGKKQYVIRCACGRERSIDKWAYENTKPKSCKSCSRNGNRWGYTRVV